MSEQSLTDADLQAVAERVVQLLRATHTPTTVWMDTAAVARVYAIGEDWVREHAGELGAIRVGDARNAPLRFHVDRVSAAMDRRRLTAPLIAPAPRRPGPARGVRNSDLEDLLPRPDRAIV